MKKIIFSVLIICLALSITGNAEGKWKRVKNESGVQVFTRPVEGSDLDEFMGVSVINANIITLAQVIGDVPSQTQWMHNCKASRVLKVVNKYTKIVYNATKTPWPTSDREVVVKSSMKIDGKAGKITVIINAINSSYPVKKGHVRMPSLSGYWSLQALERNKTKATYRIKANPGGSIPAWMANSSSKDIPLGTLKGIRRMSKKQKYIDLAKKEKGFEKFFRSLEKK